MLITEINSFLKNYYNNSGLYGNPIPISEQTEDCINCIFYKEKEYIDNIDYSVIIPIHNQESIISRNLEALIKCIEGSYEIILILDCCKDATKDIVLHFFSELFPEDCKRIVIVESTIPLFETVSDNIGFRLASGKWFLEIQADMKMTQKGFNKILTQPFLKYDNVIGVSGRCCHSLDQSELIGRGGHAIEKTISELGLSSNIFFVSEACNRGPLVLDAEKTRTMGFLDEMNYYLDYSEIDMFLRAYESYKWICGYVPIDFDAPLCDGTTRKPRDPLNEYIMNIRKSRSNGGFVSVYRERGIKRNTYYLPL